MVSDATLELHKFMQARKTLFCYSGPLSEDLLTSISNPVRHQLSETDSTDGVAKKVFGVFIEQAQNLGDAGSDFIHTNNFVLIDQKGRIRGYYDGTSQKEVDRLMNDIKSLKK